MTDRGVASPLDYEQSLFFLGPLEQNAPDTQMITRGTEGARQERPPSFLACAPVHSPY